MPAIPFAENYRLQDLVLAQLATIETEFYLTGGTAASRAYLHHRYSDDLDFFVNDDARFSLWKSRFLQSLISVPDSTCTVILNEERFGRLVFQQGDTALKIELINDVPARVGTPFLHSGFGRIDTAENILANKITAAVSRGEPKDLADIWGFCTKLKLNLRDALSNAQSKAAGIFPADVARVLCSVTETDWQVINWIDPPAFIQFQSDLIALGEQLLRPA